MFEADSSNSSDSRKGRASGIGFLRMALTGCLVCLLHASAYAADSGADGKFDKRTSAHFVLYQDVDIDRSSGFRGSRRFEQQVLSILEQAYTSLDHFLGLRPERPLTVVVYDPIIFDATYSGLFRFPAAGFYGDSIHIRGGTAVTDQLSRVLHHELVHAALDAVSPSLTVPAWFNEGVAEWFEARAAGKRRLSEHEQSILSQASSLGLLFAFSDLTSGGLGHLQPESAQLAYLQSYGFFEYLARTHGDQKLLELLDDYLRNLHLDRAFRRTFRADIARLEARFAEELGRSTR
jgi:hypothetical protein